MSLGWVLGACVGCLVCPGCLLLGCLCLGWVFPLFPLLLRSLYLRCLLLGRMRMEGLVLWWRP